MKKILVPVMLAMNFAGAAQNTAYTVSNDPDGGSLIYNGVVTYKELDNEPTFTWLKKGRDEYEPDQKKLDYLKTNLAGYSMVVFLGTWCDDSHELIPKLEKVLELSNYPQSKLTMYGVDRKKKTKNHEEKKYNITLVPTIIVFDGDKEKGRITESVTKSIEDDLAAILPVTAKAGGRKPLQELHK